VASYPSENVSTALMFPARSVQAPLSEAFAASGPE
jgi:hypothetical protein